jgi:microsomal dipeptidase-like Zn-dependent dipeptidase
MKTYPVADLHNDLLSFLIASSDRSIKDPKSRGSYPQMKQGNVAFQALTIYTDTHSNSYIQGQKQLQMLEHLLFSQPEKYALWNPGLPLSTEGPISVSLVLESAHGICEESEDIKFGLLNLEKALLKFKNILYISLTWNLENRLGGGCGSSIGLKEDGKRLLEWMDQKKIAVDLSHASDFLIDDIFNFLDKKSLEIPVIASHSNMRSIAKMERNLPDLFVQEILRRKGLIGLNFFAPFIGTRFDQIAEHVAHLFALGGENQLCFGGDFFLLEDFLNIGQKYGVTEGFFPQFSDASCYPYALAFLQKHLSLSEKQIQAIAYENFQTYVKRIFLPNEQPSRGDFRK